MDPEFDKAMWDELDKEISEVEKMKKELDDMPDDEVMDITKDKNYKENKDDVEEVIKTTVDGYENVSMLQHDMQAFIYNANLNNDFNSDYSDEF